MICRGNKRNRINKRTLDKKWSLTNQNQRIQRQVFCVILVLNVYLKTNHFTRAPYAEIPPRDAPQLPYFFFFRPILPMCLQALWGSFVRIKYFNLDFKKTWSIPMPTDWPTPIRGSDFTLTKHICDTPLVNIGRKCFLEPRHGNHTIHLCIVLKVNMDSLVITCLLFFLYIFCPS